MDLDTIYSLFGIVTVASPLLLLTVLGMPALVGYRLTEQAITRFTHIAVAVGLGSSVAILAAMLLSGDRHVPIELGNWIDLPEQHFHFNLKFVFDRLSVPFVILTYLLCGTIGAFTSRYLHREGGFVRFYIAYALFMLGMVFASLAGKSRGPRSQRPDLWRRYLPATRDRISLSRRPGTHGTARSTGISRRRTVSRFGKENILATGHGKHEN